MNRLMGLAPLPLAVAGLADSLYLMLFESTAARSCTLGGSLDCASVIGSRYSRIAGIPVALLGAIWFMAFVVLFGLGVHPLEVVIPLSTAGMAGVAYLVYIELFVLRYVCLYCTLAHLVGASIVVLSLVGAGRETGGRSRSVNNARRGEGGHEL